MTPETAKQKIQALLDLGTLKGVKVEYESGIIFTFFHDPHGILFMNTEDDDPIYAGSFELIQQGWLNGVKSIEPIPLEPKLLEVGERVKVISGRHKNSVGVILTTYDYEYVLKLDDTRKLDGTSVSIYVSIFDVIPESLLVEEEPKPKLYRVLKELPGAKVGQIIDGFEMTITHGNGSGLYGIEECEDFFEPIDPKEFEQAGYQVTKKV